MRCCFLVGSQSLRVLLYVTLFLPFLDLNWSDFFKGCFHWNLSSINWPLTFRFLCYSLHVYLWYEIIHFNTESPYTQFLRLWRNVYMTPTCLFIYLTASVLTVKRDDLYLQCLFVPFLPILSSPYPNLRHCIMPEYESINYSYIFLYFY